MALFDEILKKYKNDGVYSLFTTAPNYVLRRAEIYDYIVEKKAERKIDLSTDQYFTINYNGVWNRPYPDHISSRSGRAFSGERFVYQFKNASIGCNPEPKLCTNSFEIKLEDFNNYKIHDGINFNIKNREAKTDVDLGVLIHSKRDKAFSHWHTEVLSQLRVINELPIDSKEINIILAAPTDDGLASWQRESLALMGFEPDIVLSKNAPKIDISDVFIPNLIPFSGGGGPPYPPLRDLIWVGKTMRKNISETTGNSYERVYISRQEIGTRIVKNFEEIKPILDAYDFDIIKPENLSFEEQVQIFSEANIIIGPHGGGLMNEIFADDTIIIELIQDLYKNNHQFVLANMIGVTYDYVLCDVDNNSHHSHRFKDLIVDVNELRDVIEHYTKSDTI